MIFRLGAWQHRFKEKQLENRFVGGLEFGGKISSPYAITV